MAIPEKDLKTLWGLAAGRCSNPNCFTECVRFLADTPTLIGEMAHVIAKKPDGPRGVPGGGADTYENLILLCPTHHTEIDKAPPGTFPTEMLDQWKAMHEKKVRGRLDGVRFSTRGELGRAILPLLAENKSLWTYLGPESSAARSNPLSNAHLLWDLRKLDTIVPNNSKIAALLSDNSTLLYREHLKIAATFKIHAQAFERNCYIKTENAPRFPRQLEQIIEAYEKE